MQIGWPPSLTTVFKFASFTTINVDSASPECSVKGLDYQKKWFFTMLLPACFALSLVLAYIAKATLAYVKWRTTPVVRRKPLKGKGYATLVNLYLGAINLMYIFLIQKALEVHRCKLVGDEMRLAADPNEKCFGPEYEKLTQYSFIALAIYGGGVPLVFSTILFRHRYHIIADQQLRVRSMSDTLNTNPFYFMQKRFKRLYFKFVPERYYR